MMILPITDRHTLTKIENPAFAAYAETYVRIHEDFLQQIEATGVPLAEAQVFNKNHAGSSTWSNDNAQVNYRNQGKSIYVNDISPACVACQTGIGSATFFISFNCNRNCWFCFNPNEENYHIFSQRKRNLQGELAQIHRNGLAVYHLALTGGEPLLHKQETLAFFRDAKEKFPGVHARLYTCGDGVDAAILRDLAHAGLDEIRFSIKIEDVQHGNRQIYEKIALAKNCIPQVMVEMPVIPGTLPLMKKVLTTLDQLQIFGINLLEFCFPFQNAKTYRAKGFQIKNPPFRVLYNYNYAGGLPVADSEQECLALIKFAAEEQMQIGVHYCSLENKLTAQLYQQNSNQLLPEHVHFSQKDYFLKTAKVFGKDARRVRRLLERKGEHTFSKGDESGYLEFHVDDIQRLPTNMEVALCSSVVEQRNGARYLRELQVALTTPRQFERSAEV